MEDIFKVTLSSVAADTSSGKKPAMPDLNSVRSAVSSLLSNSVSSVQYAVNVVYRSNSFIYH